MRLSVDTGGTFTDLLIEKNDSTISVFKVPTTPSNPSIGILKGVNKVAESLNLSTENFLSNLTSLDLLTSKLSDDDKFKENCVLKPLNKLINLTYLNLGFTNVRFVEPLQNLSKLEYLNLRYTKVADPSSIIFNQSKYKCNMFNNVIV